MSDWKEAKFDDLVRLKRGYDLPRQNIVDGKYPVITSSNIKAYHHQFKVKPPGVVTGRSGTLGIVQYVNQEFWPLNTALYATEFRGNFPKYVYYYLSEMKLESFNAGAGVPTLNQNHLQKLPIKIPSLVTQKKIAAILSSYDDLIENNKHRIALLENMAEEIYREWFVRFRFPSYKTTEFEKGIPKGWFLERIDSLGKVITGKTPSTTNSKYYGGNIPFVKTPDMHGNMFVYETEELLTEDGLNSQPSQVLEKDAICVSCIGTGGVVSVTTQRCSTNQQINSLTLNALHDREWAFFTLKALKPTIQAFGATGATMTNLSKGKFAGITAIIPSNELRLEFSRIINPMFEEIQVLSIINKNLNSTKSSLLPRLTSGRLSVECLGIQFPPSMHDENIA